MDHALRVDTAAMISFGLEAGVPTVRDPASHLPGSSVQPCRTGHEVRNYKKGKFGRECCLATGKRAVNLLERLLDPFQISSLTGSRQASFRHRLPF